MLFNATKTDEGQLLLSGGQIISNFHDDGVCMGDVCPVHKPSDHKFKNAPLFFNGVHMYRVIDGEMVIDPDDYVFNRFGKAILRNSAKCHRCDTTAMSTDRHDYQTCECGNVFVDGGFDYARHGCLEPDAYEDTSIIVRK